MVDYERAVQKRKKQLFQRLLKLLPSEPVVVEVGIGSFPNALYLAKAQGMDLVGVDPNEYMPLGSQEPTRGLPKLNMACEKMLKGHSERCRGSPTRSRMPRGLACWSPSGTTSCGCCGASPSDCRWRIASRMRRTGGSQFGGFLRSFIDS